MSNNIDTFQIFMSKHQILKGSKVESGVNLTISNM